MKKTVLASIVTIGLVGFNLVAKKSIATPEKVVNPEIENRLMRQVDIVKQTVNGDSNFNQSVAFFIDMKIHSGKNRFFVYDLKANKIVDQGLVAHGFGSETGVQGKLKFSNVSQSLCTSLGKYEIGESYNGQFGKAYKLHGLDTSNSNAYARNIVLHQYSRMPYEQQQQPVCNSYGCPMVNEKYFDRIEKIIDESDKGILLDIYY